MVTPIPHRPTAEPATGWRHFARTFLRGGNRPDQFYRFLGASRTLAPDTRYLNLGFWRDRPSSYLDAANALAAELASFARLPSGRGRLRTLDVGFGFGEQDLLWATRFGADIVGLNVTLLQVVGAKQSADAAGLADRIRLLRASATNMPVASQAFDRVLALECAFHFPTRRDFLAEAHRALGPEGILAAADIVTRPGGRFPWLKPVLMATGRRFWHIPGENMVGSEIYRGQLAELGFDGIELRDISADVFPGIRRYMALSTTLATFRPVERPLVKLCGYLFWLAWALGWIDYVLVRAVKRPS